MIILEKPIGEMTPDEIEATLIEIYKLQTELLWLAHNNQSAPPPLSVHVHDIAGVEDRPG